MSRINTDSPFKRRIAQLKAELIASIGKPRRLLTDAEMKEMAERAHAGRRRVDLDDERRHQLGDNISGEGG